MSHPSIIEQRRDQALPTLTPAESERLRRFGEVQATLYAWLFAREEEAAATKEAVHA